MDGALLGQYGTQWDLIEIVQIANIPALSPDGEINMQAILRTSDGPRLSRPGSAEHLLVKALSGIESTRNRLAKAGGRDALFDLRLAKRQWRPGYASRIISLPGAALSASMSIRMRSNRSIITFRSFRESEIARS